MTTGYKFAENTPVSAQDSVAEIKEWLERFGIFDVLNYDMAERGCSMIGFQAKSGAFLIYVPLPDEKAFPRTSPPTGAKERAKAHRNAYEQEKARLLRVVFNLVKMKLVAAAEGVTTLEKEFFSDLVIWNAEGRQQTAYEWYAPQIEHLRAEGLQPPVLPALENPRLLPGPQRKAIEGK